MNFIQKIINTKDSKILVLLDQSIVSGTNFILGVLIARFLGIEQFGIYGFIFLIYLLVLGVQQAFFVIPMYSLGVNYHSRDKLVYLDSLLVVQVIFSSIMAILCVVIFTFFQFEFSNQVRSIRGLIGLSAFFILVHDFVRRLFLYRNLLRNLMILDCLSYGLQIVLLLVIIVFGDLTLKYCFTIVCFSFLFSILYGLYLLGMPEINLRQIWELLGRHWNYSKWLLARAILTYSSGNLFVVAAGTLLGPVAIGAIKMGQNLHGIINVFFLAVENHVPIVSASLFKAKGRIALYKYLKGTAVKSLIICSILALLVLSFSTWLISNLYGAEYQIYSYVLIWFAVINLLVCISMPFRFVLRTLEQTRELFLATVFTALFGFFFAYPLIQTYQLSGVLIGLLISQLIMIASLGSAVFITEKSRKFYR